MSSSPPRDRVAMSQRVVVKIGSAVLTDERGAFDLERHAALCEQLAQVGRERQVIVVSSGAIALGVERLGLGRRPTELPLKQAAAAVGQCRLMHRYEEELGQRGRVVAQLLSTHADVADHRRYLNARQTLAALLSAGVIPIINENDTVSVEEIQFGDNDALAGLVAGLCDAELLVLLSDVEGLYDRDPRVAGPTPAVLIDEIPELTPALEAMASGATSKVGTGGMAAKLRAARRAAEIGAQTVIASGKRPGVLAEVLAGHRVGTVIGRGAAPTNRLRLRQRWIAHALEPEGVLRVDAGAATALLERGGSLLSSGLVAVEGQFGRGSPVEVAGPDGAVFARGLSGYGADELRLIRGLHSSLIEQRLGYKYLDEVIHRDDLVLLGSRPG